MPITPEMEERLQKIHALEQKGYSLKTSFFGFSHIVTNPEGDRVYTFNNRNKDKSLPGWSPIGFFWAPYVAVQSKDWSYFWVLGFSTFTFSLLQIGLGLSDLGFLNSIFSFCFAYIYAHNFPYQRWFFSKSNKKEIGKFLSIPLALFFFAMVFIPTVILQTATNSDLRRDIQSLTTEKNSNLESSSYYDSGMEKKNSEDYSGAIDDFTKAIELDPKDVSSYNSRGATKADQGDYLGAIDDYNKAIEIDPDYWRAYFNRGRALVKGQENYYGAISDYNKVIEIDPQIADAYYNRGIYKGNGLKDYTGAIDDFTKTIEIDPRNVNAYNNRGYFKEFLGDHLGGIDDFTKAIEIDPQDIFPYVNRGRFKSLYLNDHSGAIVDINKAISIEPNFADSYAYRGDVKTRQNDMEGACSDYKKAASLGYETSAEWLKSDQGSWCRDLNSK